MYGVVYLYVDYINEWRKLDAGHRNIGICVHMHTVHTHIHIKVCKV